MKYLYILVFCIFCIVGLAIFFADSYIGAGVRGNIKEYKFDFSEKLLMDEINEVVDANDKTDWVNIELYLLNRFGSDTLWKKEVGISFAEYKDMYKEYNYISLLGNKEKYILRIKTYPNSESTSNIKLISAAVYGETLPMAKYISPSQKEKYSKLFEREVISKLVR